MFYHRYVQIIFSLGFFTCTVMSHAQSLKVSENRHFIVHADGSPFFYLGDTAWELFHRLNRLEADAYLQDRADKGFTVIQAVVLAELDGLHTPNPYMHTPLVDDNPATPNEEYFKHVDYIVNKAQSLGLYIGMLPTWGDKFNKKWGVGPEIFTTENARTYGEFLGNRYRQKPIIWILGGDRNPETESHKAVIRAMAEGIRNGSGTVPLITYHPQRGSISAQFFGTDEWLSFNMFQSGHGRLNHPNDSITYASYQFTPVRPTLDGEPRYEDHPVNHKPENGWFDEFDVRQAAYWSMLAGAAGHTYGNHNIWQMWQPDREPLSSARTPWRDALEHPGSEQMGYMRRLFESRPWQTLVPDQAVAVESDETSADHLRAARAEKGSFLMVYVPTGRSITVDLGMVSGSKVNAWWYNPRSGGAALIGKLANTKNPMRFDPPGQEDRGNDWVLVLDDASERFGMPGGEPLKFKRGK